MVGVFLLYVYTRDFNLSKAIFHCMDSEQILHWGRKMNVFLGYA